uniref:Uncharacterized protein n=1 Tax=Romanomermis culicivorax TaxID=13658 RepID=A0A915JTI8_ROMCU
MRNLMMRSFYTQNYTESWQLSKQSRSTMEKSHRPSSAITIPLGVHSPVLYCQKDRSLRDKTIPPQQYSVSGNIVTQPWNATCLWPLILDFLKLRRKRYFRRLHYHSSYYYCPKKNSFAVCAGLRPIL